MDPLFALEITETTTATGLLAVAVSALAGVIAYVFKVTIPRSQERSDERFDKMLDRFMAEINTDRSFLREEMAKRDEILRTSLSDFGVRVDALAERVSECPSRGVSIPVTTERRPAVKHA